METLSHRFIDALALPRDRLYARALALCGTPAQAEAALLQATRAAFAHSSANPRLDAAATVEKELAQTPATTPSSGTPPAAEPAPAAMPADLWARLSAAVQLEAARSAQANMLAADSVLLKPDPILAPKRKLHKPDDQGVPVRTLTFILLALALGAAITIYILTRPQ